MTEDIIPALEPMFRKIFSAPELIITRELNATQVEKWDSLTHVQMLYEVEKLFGIKFKLKELTSMKNVGDMVDLIIQKRSV
jgi:acyl carrier protein